MRRRTPIKIINGRVYCWVKMTEKEIRAMPEFYQRGREKGFPYYCLGCPHTKRQILTWPRATGATTVGINVKQPIEE